MPQNDHTELAAQKNEMMARRLREFAHDARQAADAAEVIALGLEQTGADDISGLTAAALDPRQLAANAVSVPSVAAKKAQKIADMLAAQAVVAPNALSIHKTAGLRGVAVNTMRRKLPTVPVPTESPGGDTDIF